MPWKGYFDLIGRVDEFVLYDDVQFTKRDWRNRNKIKTPRGLRWLTIPVITKGKYRQTIGDTAISDPAWREDHLALLRHNYAQAPHFDEAFPWIERLYAELLDSQLSGINRSLIRRICEWLGIATKITRSADYRLDEGKNERLIGICEQAGASHYVTGPAARSYLNEEAFSARGIAVEWMDYEGYPEYPQLYPPFEHKVSILDLILHTGSRAAEYVRRA